MAQANKKRQKRKPARKSNKLFAHLNKILTFVFIMIVFLVSVGAVGYVIFFRTVFAEEILPNLKSAIVFEEPDPPPPHDEPVVAEVLLPKPVLPKVAIIFDDLGYHQVLGEALLAFPFELTYSFLPFAPHTRELQELAYLSGKTVLLHLPLEPKGAFFNPGPGALYLNDGPDVQKEKIIQCLEEVPRATGLNNHMGSQFTENVQAMAILMEEIEKRSLFFIDSYTTSDSVGMRVAQEKHVKSARRSVFLDNILEEEQICGQLEKLVVFAEKKGWAIGIAHPHQVTVKAITECAGRFNDRVQYVSVKEVM